jgi:hypothetical protein
VPLFICACSLTFAAAVGRAAALLLRRLGALLLLLY